MKKLKKLFITITVLFLILIMSSNIKVNASSIKDLIQEVEYSEEFKKWL